MLDFYGPLVLRFQIILHFAKMLPSPVKSFLPVTIGDGEKKRCGQMDQREGSGVVRQTRDVRKQDFKGNTNMFTSISASRAALSQDSAVGRLETITCSTGSSGAPPIDTDER